MKYPGTVERENYRRNQEKQQRKLYLGWEETKANEVEKGIPGNGKSVYEKTEIKQHDESWRMDMM